LSSLRRLESLGPELAYPLLATFLLSGGRAGEVLGIELDDVSFDRQTITFRPNTWRRLKTQTSWRVVPLFPQLAEILRPYVFGPRLERPGRRVEQHFERLGGELVRLGFDTKIGTNPQAGTEKRSPRSHRSASGGRRSRVGPARLERATSCSGAA
jgi:integrase